MLVFLGAGEERDCRAGAAATVASRKDVVEGSAPAPERARGASRKD